MAVPKTFTTTIEHLCDIKIIQRCKLNFDKAKRCNVSTITSVESILVRKLITVRLIPNAPAEKLVTAILAFPVQNASAKAAPMITIVPKGRVAVTAFAKMASFAWGLLVLLTLFAETGEDVVREYVSSPMIGVTILPPSLAA